MDSPAFPSQPARFQPSEMPRWALSRGAAMSEADAAFMAGAALNSLDNLVRAQLGWAGAWRQRQALKCAVAGMRLMGRGEDEAALRDAVLLCAPGMIRVRPETCFWPLNACRLA